MNAVIGMSYLLLQENPQPYQLEKLKTLRFSAENLLALINDILDFNKIESGMVTFEQIDFNLFDLLNGVKHALKFKAQEKNIRLKVKYDDDIPEILVGDPTRLTQVLINLIGNAIKFTEQGTVTIDIEAKEENSTEVDICFNVKDTGIGIPADKLPLIFERFSQANGDTTRKFGGSGLGLSIIKNLLELQGSEILVESEHGVGSQFYFTLKFKKSEKAFVHNNTNSLIGNNQKDLAHIKILVVEDNKINQMVANEFLSKWQATVTFAENGIIALEKIENNQFDIVLMDLQMPEMDGYEATRVIRNHNNEQVNKLPIIALTASVMVEVKEKVQKSGFDGYVSKPFNPNELYTKIKKLVPHKNLIEKGDQQAIISYKKLEEMADGNIEFKKAMLAQLAKDIVEFNELFVKGALNRDLKEISFAVHRFQTSLELFELNQIKQYIKQIRKLIESDLSDKDLTHTLEEYTKCLNKLKEEF
jgi:CheY-like chemotaxis protein